MTINLACRVGYLFSIDTYFSKSIYKLILDKNNNVGTLHYWSLYINLKQQTNTFNIQSVESYFYNKKLNDKYEKWIKTECKKHNNSDDVSPFSIINLLIKLYKDKYKYVFIPVLLDYNIPDLHIIHQASLIVDLKSNNLLFYEPYGKYEKNNKSYKESIINHFNQLLPTITYHDHLGLDTGIQTIIKLKNNENIQELINLIESLTYDIKKEILDKKKVLDLITDDKIAVILDILHNYKLYDKFIGFYCENNSQTCVSITLIELIHFFNDDNINYDNFKIDRPNTFLYQELNKLLEQIKDKLKIENINKVLTKN